MDDITDERLRELTVIAARERARVEEIKRLRAELDAARAEVERLRDELREVAAFKETVKWPKETNQ